MPLHSFLTYFAKTFGKLSILEECRRERWPRLSRSPPRVPLGAQAIPAAGRGSLPTSAWGGRRWGLARPHRRRRGPRCPRAPKPVREVQPRITKGKECRNEPLHPLQRRRVAPRRAHPRQRPRAPLRQHQGGPPRVAQLTAQARCRTRGLRAHRALSPKPAPMPRRRRPPDRARQSVALPALRRGHRRARQERPCRRRHADPLRTPRQLGKQPSTVA